MCEKAKESLAISPSSITVAFPEPISLDLTITSLDWTIAL